MAKKRLNKRVILLLVSMGLLVSLGAVTVAIIMQPKDPEVTLRAGQEALESKQYAQAVRFLSEAVRAVRETSEKPKYLLALAEAELEWYGKDITLNQSQRDSLFWDAHGQLSEAAQIQPRNEDAQKREEARKRQITALERLTELDFRIASARNEWEQFLRNSDRLLAVKPKDADALFRRGVGKARLAKTRPDFAPAAVKDMQDAITLAPDREDFYLTLAGFLVDQKQNEEVEKVYKQALGALTESLTLRLSYAEFLQLSNRKSQAKDLLEKAIADNPKQAEGHLAMAQYWQREKNMNEAVASLQRAIQAEPSEYRGYSSLALMHLYRNNQDMGEEVLKQGLDRLRKASASVAETARENVQERMKKLGQEQDKNKVAQAEKSEQERLVRRYRDGILTLDHILCDLILDRLESGAKPEDVVPRVEEALKEMKGINETHPMVIKLQGRLLLIDNKLLEAEQLLRRAYDSFPGLEVKTSQLLIMLYRRLGQLGESETILRRYLAVSRDNPHALQMLASLYIDYRQYEQAQQVLLEALKLDPENGTLRAMSAGVDAVMGRTNRVPAALLTQGKQLDVTAKRLFMLRARQLWSEGNYPAAAQLVDDVLRGSPGDIEAIGTLIEWYKTVNMTAAQQVLQQALAAYKDNPGVQAFLMSKLETDPNKLMKLQMDQAELEKDPVLRAIALAGIHHHYKQKEKAAELLKQAEEKDPKNPRLISAAFEQMLENQDFAAAAKWAKLAGEADLDRVQGRMYKARLARAQGKLDEALSLAGEAVIARPVYSQGHAFLGDCYLAGKQPARAREEFEKAFQQNPANMAAIMGMIEVTGQVGKPGEQAYWIEQAYKFAPDDPRIREAVLVQREARERDQPDKLIRVREELRRREPENADNLRRLGYLYEKIRRSESAEEVYRTLVKATKAEATAVGTLADFLRRTDRHAEALKLLIDYTKECPDRARAYALLGGYLEVSLETAQAQAAYEKAIAESKDGAAYEDFARFWIRQEDWEKAVEWQRKYVDKRGEKVEPNSQRELVALLVQAGKYPEAEQRIRAALDKNPAYQEMLVLRGYMYFKQNDLVKARDSLDRALGLRPDDPQALAYRAEVHLANNDQPRALADLQLARKSTAPAATILRLAGLYDRMGDFSSAEGVLQSLLAEQPDHPVALRVLTQISIAHKKWTSAEAVIQAGHKAYAQDPYFYLKEGEMWRQRNDPARAIPAMKKAAELAPGQADLKVLLLAAYANAGRFDEVLKTGKDLVGHPEVGPQAQAVCGFAHARLKNQAQAEADFTAAMKQAKSGSALGFVIAQIQEAYGEQALERLVQWAAARPDDAQLLQSIGGGYAERGQYKSAIEFFGKALAAAKPEERLLILQGLALANDQMSNGEESLKAYKEAYAIDPKNAITLNNMAWLLVDTLKRPKEALPYAKEAMELRPNDAHVLDTLGLIYLLLEDYKQAEEVLNRSVNIQAIPANCYHLGQTYEKLKRPADALRQYERGLELLKDKPNDPLYKALQEAIRRLASPGRK